MRSAEINSVGAGQRAARRDDQAGLRGRSARAQPRCRHARVDRRGRYVRDWLRFSVRHHPASCRWGGDRTPERVPPVPFLLLTVFSPAWLAAASRRPRQGRQPAVRLGGPKISGPSADVTVYRRRRDAQRARSPMVRGSAKPSLSMRLKLKPDERLR